MHFPLFLEFDDRPCLVVGGGRVAVRKATVLRSFGAVVTVVAPDGDAALGGLEGVRWIRRAFRDADLDGQTLVVAATDDVETNARVARLCRTRDLPVNTVDDPSNCTFFFPALCRRGPIVAAVSSEGTCPVAAQLVRDRIGRELSEDFIEAVERLGERREELKRLFPDPSARRQACER